MFEVDPKNGRAIPPELYDEPRWYACYTRARHEKRVERALAERRVDSYLPLVQRERQWKDRRKLVAFPLFPSYVFARFAWRHVHDVLTTPGVSTVVRMDGRPAPIPDEDLENVRRFTKALVETGLEPEPRPFVREGQRVRVTNGPFQGVEGVVAEQRGTRRVLVGLPVIRQGFEVDLDLSVLQPLR
ncbi:MAG: UpxY family transcription antiterminator [Gemmatimonadota bacterium]|jgi:transcription elongation factor/antiterminator RfaH